MALEIDRAVNELNTVKSDCPMTGDTGYTFSGKYDISTKIRFELKPEMDEIVSTKEIKEIM